MQDILIEVFCGVSVEDMCGTQRHPVNEVKLAEEVVGYNKSLHWYSNSPDFVLSIRRLAREKGVQIKFYLDGVCHEDDVEPIFEDFNKALTYWDEDPSVEPAEKIGAFQDKSGRWYILPLNLMDSFNKDKEDEDFVDGGGFEGKYGQYADEEYLREKLGDFLYEKIKQP